MKVQELAQIVPHGELRDLINAIHACHVGRIMRDQSLNRGDGSTRERIVVDLGDRGRLELESSAENKSAWHVALDLIGLPNDPSGALVSKHMLSGEQSRRELNQIELAHLLGAAHERISKEVSSEYRALREMAAKVLDEKPLTEDLKGWHSVQAVTPLTCVTGDIAFQSRFESVGRIFRLRQENVDYVLFRGFSIPDGAERLEEVFFGPQSERRGPGYACLLAESAGRFGRVNVALAKGNRTALLEALEEAA